MPKRISRRAVLASSAAVPAMAAPAAKAFATAPIYQRLGVRTFINAVGTITTLSGTLMDARVLRAMEEASRNFVAIHELQGKAGARIAELTGAEAAFVTNGASCALCLSTCAVTAGADKSKMTRLPDLTGMKSEIVIQKRHRNMYDHAFRMVGVKLVDVLLNAEGGILTGSARQVQQRLKEREIEMRTADASRRRIPRNRFSHDFRSLPWWCRPRHSWPSER